LFRQLIHDRLGSGAFAWYLDTVPGAFPPKSMFVLLLAMLPGLLLPGVAIWWVGGDTVFAWIKLVAILLISALLLDVLSTRLRYRRWQREWMCADCRRSFRPAAATLPCHGPGSVFRGRVRPIISLFVRE
jgi:hypothetical protein